MTALLEIGLINAALATILAIGVWIVTRIWRQPVLAHALWVVVLVKLVTPPMIGIPWQFSSKPKIEAAQNVPAAPITFEQAVGTTAAEPTIDHAPLAASAAFPAITADDFAFERAEIPQSSASLPLETYITLAAIVWLAGSGIFFAVTIIRLTAFHRALAHASPAPGDLEELAEQVAERFGIQNYRLRVTEGRLTPLVWPIGQPTIVFSRPLLSELSPDEIQTLLAHEFAHLRRKDHWVRWLELAAVTIYWWHPVAWCARTMIRQTEERACDAWVTWAFPDTAVRYATALFTTVEFVSNPCPAPPMVASRLSADGNLTERIKDVMNGNCDRRLSFVSKCAILIVALVALPLSLQGVQAADEQAAAGGAPNTVTLSDAGATTTVSVSGTSGSVAPPATGAPVTTTISESGTTTTPGSGAGSTVTISNPGAAPAPMPGGPGSATFQEAGTPPAATPGLSVSFVGTAPSSKIEQDIEQQLQTPVQLAFKEVPLQEVLSVLGDSVHIDIHLDAVGMQASDEPVTITLKNKVSLRSALNLILKPLKLKYVVEDEVLKITNGQPLVATVAEHPVDRYSTTHTAPAAPAAASNTASFQLPGATVREKQNEAASSSPTSDAPASVSVWLKIVESKQRSYERMQALAKKNVVSTSEVEQARNDYEISLERQRQALRALETDRLQIQLAEIELREAVEANKAKAGSVSDLQVQKLKIKLALATAKLRELNE